MESDRAGHHASRCNPTKVRTHSQSHSQSIISQFFTSSRMISLCRSIFQCVYNDRVAAAALRCPGPTPPLVASSCDLHRQVARFLPSLSGCPNQYLKLVNMLSFMKLGGQIPTSGSLHWLSPLYVLPYPMHPSPRTRLWVESVIGRLQ